MTSNQFEWMVVGVAVVAFLLVTIGEGVFFRMRNGSPTVRSVTYALVSNLLGFGIGGIVFFIVFAVILALAWSGDLANVPGGEASIWAAVIFGFAFPILFLFLMKRALMSMFGVGRGITAWVHSIAWAVLATVATFAPSVLIVYFSAGKR